MNELIDIMASDMGITPYTNEQRKSFEYRVIYSALGLWSLNAATNIKNEIKGISRNSLTALIHSLLDQYLVLAPLAKSFLISSKHRDIAVHIREVYEQMGYFCEENNKDRLNQGGETVCISEKDYLYLGIPNEKYHMVGLGIHSSCGKQDMNIKEYLVRDDIPTEEYLLSCFNICNFEAKNIDPLELEYFNPFYRGKLSDAWIDYRNADMTVARKSPIGPFYLVTENSDNALLFADYVENSSKESKTGAEYNRMYAALRQYYLNSMQVIICKIDEEYSYIRILGQLPNREYLFILLNAWPYYGFSDRNSFILHKEQVNIILQILVNIGFEVEERVFNG